MKLDTSAIRYLTAEDWRVLTAVEMGSKNHEVVPTPLIGQIAGLRGSGGHNKSISALAKVGLIAKVKNSSYDGYRLTYGGLDYLALNTHRKASTIFSVGNQIGVGKESDIYAVASDSGRRLVLKIHRLGRISFRTVKANRDYLRNRNSGSWMYLSRLAAMKEYAFMKVLRREGFPVPEPVGQSRHTVVMELIDSFPLRQIESVPDPAGLYAELMDLIVRLAQVGLIHGDFNEFNILIKEEAVTPQEVDDQPIDRAIEVESEQADQQQNDAHNEESAPPAPKTQLIPIIIDFPQMLSTTHSNAAFYFDRDVACIKRFFQRRFHFTADEPGPFFADAMKEPNKDVRLDLEVEATGFSRKMAKDLEKSLEATGGDHEQGVDGALERPISEVDDENAQNEEEVDDSDSGAESDDDQELVGDFGGLSLKGQQDQGLSKPQPYIPLDLSTDPDALAEKVHIKKKAAGWAI